MHYFVYLLQSLHTPTTTRMYIGFTPKPRRRLRQHNGEIKGGAKKTSQHRPWEHVCIVSGFPNKFVAYMFEHQWQSCFGHMRPSRVIKDALVGLDYRSKGWKGRFMVLHTMLQLPLWKQMNLAVHFLKPAQQVYFESLQRALAAPDRTECKVVTVEEVDEMHVESKDTSIAGLAVGALPSSSAAVACGVCQQTALQTPELSLFCCPGCHGTTHLTCLARSSRDYWAALDPAPGPGSGLGPGLGLPGARPDENADNGTQAEDDDATGAGAGAGAETEGEEWGEGAGATQASQASALGLGSQRTQPLAGAAKGRAKADPKVKKAATARGGVKAKAKAKAPAVSVSDLSAAELRRLNVRDRVFVCPADGCGDACPRGRAARMCFKPASLKGRGAGATAAAAAAAAGAWGNSDDSDDDDDDDDDDDEDEDAEDDDDDDGDDDGEGAVLAGGGAANHGRDDDFGFGRPALPASQQTGGIFLDLTQTD